MSADELNRAVTVAIIEAEAHDYDGALLWEKVAACERAIAESKDSEISDMEREIAESGVETATARARLLRRKPLESKP